MSVRGRVTVKVPDLGIRVSLAEWLPVGQAENLSPVSQRR